MNLYEAKRWVLDEYSKLDAMIAALDSDSVIALSLADGYDDRLCIYKKPSSEAEGQQILSRATHRSGSVDDVTKAYFWQHKMPAIVLSAAGSRWTYKDEFQGAEIESPFDNLRVYAYSPEMARQMLDRELSKVATKAIADLQGEIAGWERAIAGAQPQAAIDLQRKVDSMTNEGGDGYYRPLPASLDSVPELEAELKECKEELQYWQALGLG